MAKTKKQAETVDELLEEDTEELDLDPDSAPTTSVADDFDEEVLALDLGEIDEDAAGFTPVPQGTYECFIEQMELKKSQAGNPMIEARYKIKEGEHENRLFFDHFVLNNEWGRGRLKKMLMQLGFAAGDEHFDLKEFIESGKAIGTPLRVKVNIKMQNGEKRNNIQAIMPSAEDDPFFN